MPRNKQFAILGLGRFGCSVTKTLAENGYDVLACDKDIDIVREMSQFATQAMQVDVTDEMALSSLGLSNFDVVVVAIGNDLEPCVMATLFAKQCGAKYVIAKANNQTQKKILEKIGADRVVLPEWEMGEKIATELTSTHILDYIKLSKDFGIVEISPLPQWVGLSLHKSNIRAVTGINIVAIKRGKSVIASPKPDVVIESGDILVAVSDYKDLHRLGVLTNEKQGGL